MQKASDQAGSIIFKDKRSEADKRAKAAFAKGVETKNDYILHFLAIFLA